MLDETNIPETDLLSLLKVLIINNSKIVETSSELNSTSSELISTGSELIQTIAEQILTMAHRVVHTTAGRWKNRLIIIVYLGERARRKNNRDTASHRRVSRGVIYFSN